MAEVIRRKLRPGETIFGGGKGVISLNFRNSPEKPSLSETDGLMAEHRAFEARLMAMVERQMAQEKLEAQNGNTEPPEKAP